MAPTEKPYLQFLRDELKRSQNFRKGREVVPSRPTLTQRMRDRFFDLLYISHNGPFPIEMSKESYFEKPTHFDEIGDNIDPTNYGDIYTASDSRREIIHLVNIDQAAGTAFDIHHYLGKKGWVMGRYFHLSELAKQHPRAMKKDQPIVAMDISLSSVQEGGIVYPYILRTPEGKTRMNEIIWKRGVWPSNFWFAAIEDRQETSEEVS